MKNVMNTELQPRGGGKPSSNASLYDLVKRFFESIKKKCCELSLVNSASTNNKQTNDNNVNSQLSWIIASLGQVAHFTSVVIRNDNKVNSQLTTHNSLVKAIAFTLAETLVVMGIIGVVAALTIPNLNQSTGDREKVAKLKKVYSNLEDAFGRATAVYGPIDEWFINDNNNNVTMSERFANRVTEFMKISKNCPSDENGCMATVPYKDLDGNATGLNFVEGALYKSHPKYLFADGTAIAFDIINGSCNEDYSSSDTTNNPLREGCGGFYVDIDGAKGANTIGKDLFLFYITKTGVYPMGSKLSSDASCFRESTSCAAWVIETGNMDYLKANKGVCPNGTTLSWENTSCK